MTGFTIESFYNAHLADGADRVDAVVSISADGDPVAAGPAQDATLTFVIDRSGSMDGERIHAVKNAVRRAVQMVPEHMYVQVIVFSDTAEVVCPLRRATEQTKADADQRLRRLEASGGTAFSTGLNLARQELAQMPDAIHQVVFVTDGENNDPDRPRLAQALKRIQEDPVGQFQCDVWGVGTEWQVGQGQEVARALLGKASLISDPANVETAFRAAVEKAQAKAFKNARLRVWTPVGASVLACKQVTPTIEDLTGRSSPVSPQVRDYPLGSWGIGEDREYHLTISIQQPGTIGEEMLAARPSFVYEEHSQDVEVKAPMARIVATWTHDEALSSRIDVRVAHYTGQAELARAIQEGLEKREQGDEGAATNLLGKAVKIAAESGNDEMTARLKRVVDVEDAATGTVRLKKGVDKAATMDLELESSTTKRVRRTTTPTS